MAEYTETKCATCEHSKICMFKQDFILAQKTIDELVVNLEDMRIKNLSDLDFIKPVILDCVHYLTKKKSIRAGTGERMA